MAGERPAKNHESSAAYVGRVIYLGSVTHYVRMLQICKIMPIMCCFLDIYRCINVCLYECRSGCVHAACSISLHKYPSSLPIDGR